MLKRSPFKRVPAIQQYGVFKSVDYKFSERLISWSQEAHANVVLSQLVEDAVKRLSKAETAADNQTQSLERAWATLVQRGLLEKEHNFKEVDWQAEPAYRNPKVDSFA